MGKYRTNLKNKNKIK